MSTISVRTYFSAGHRILGLDGPGEKCRNVHGHTWYVTWVFDQNADEFTLEFGAVKQALRTMIAELFDHCFIVGIDDEFRIYLKTNTLKHYVVDGQPTTEVIATEIATRSLAVLPGAPLRSVEIQEGPDNVATWTRPVGVDIFGQPLVSS